MNALQNLFSDYKVADIISELSPANRSALGQLAILDSVDSTSLAVQRLSEEERHGHAVVANQQTAGRGRHGRNWYSPPGQNIYFSLGWNFQKPAGMMARFPLAAAVALVRAMHRFGVRSAGIKWPNDIQVEGRKLAGILVELRSYGPKQSLAVIGIGANVLMPLDQAGLEAIDQPWTSVCDHLQEPAGAGLRNRLCGILLDELLRCAREFDAQGFGPFEADWTRWDVLQGKEVSVRGRDELVVGTAAGLSPGGGLLVACKSGSGGTQMREFFAGDVSIRAA